MRAFSDSRAVRRGSREAAQAGSAKPGPTSASAWASVSVSACLRHDFSEFCQVVPPAESEYGRDDAAKCGYFRVDVFDDGHVAYAVRSHGRERTPNEFMDVDRGYYPRSAFIDRRFDPRPAAGVFTALASLFPGREPFVPIEGASDGAIDFEHAGARYRLVCARREVALAALGTLAEDDVAHDLFTGRETAVSDLRASMMRDTPGDKDALHVVLAPPG